jgi:hypothetical protein
MRRSFAFLPALLAVAVAPALVAAQQHAHHTGVPERLGTVHLQTSCRPEVAAEFNRAVALLHSFEFGASIAGFNSVLAQDPTCAMAYWGLALSHWNNPMAPSIRSTAVLQRGRETVEAARRVSAGASERERDYLAAVAQLFAGYETRDQPTRLEAYEAAMGALAAKYPGDTEARIFHALAIAGAARLDDQTYAKQLQAGAMLEALFERMPEHPGTAHYIIHAYDYPPLAARAAAAAQRYAEIAPSAAHALHMPSHTFTRIGMWQESAESNIRSMEAAAVSGSWSEVLHAADYRVYAYMQMRADSLARAVLAQLPDIEAKFDVTAVTGAAPGWGGVYGLAAMPARYALERRDWAAAAALPLTRDRIPQADALTWFARALGASNTGDRAAAKAAIDSLAVLSSRLSERRELYWAEQVDIQRQVASAWLDFAEGRTDQALRAMRVAAGAEDATEKAAVTPGPLAPARELLGDMLMKLNRPSDALIEYTRTQQREPNRYRSLLGAHDAATAAGDAESRAKYADQLQRLTGVAPATPE